SPSRCSRCATLSARARAAGRCGSAPPAAIPAGWPRSTSPRSRVRRVAATGARPSRHLLNEGPARSTPTLRKRSEAHERYVVAGTDRASPQKGPQMPRIVITHAVRNVERWLAGKAERAAALPGATNITDLVAMDGSNQAAVAFDLDDLDALKA